jgi:hypothetical protein
MTLIAVECDLLRLQFGKYFCLSNIDHEIGNRTRQAGSTAVPILAPTGDRECRAPALVTEKSRPNSSRSGSARAWEVPLRNDGGRIAAEWRIPRI